MDILEALKNAGVSIPEDKLEDFKKDFHSSYKASAEVEKIRTKLTDAETQLTAANEKITSFGDADPAKLKDEIADWQKKYNDATAESAKKFAALETEQAIKDGLSSVKFTSALARDGIVGKIKEKGLKLDNGKLLGFEDTLKEFKTNYADAFAPDEPEKKPTFSNPKDKPGDPSHHEDNVSMEDALRAHYGMK